MKHFAIWLPDTEENRALKTRLKVKALQEGKMLQDLVIEALKKAAGEKDKP